MKNNIIVYYQYFKKIKGYYSCLESHAGVFFKTKEAMKKYYASNIFTNFIFKRIYKKDLEV